MLKIILATTSLCLTLPFLNTIQAEETVAETSKHQTPPATNTNKQEKKEIQFLTPYAHKKNELIAMSDKCEMVGAKDLLHTNAYTISELRKERENIKAFFHKIRTERKKCYQAVQEKLKDLLESGNAHLTEHLEDIIFHRQNEIDQSLAELFKIRMEISDQLLESTLQDITISIQAPIDDEEASSSFYTESSRTRSLVRQEIAILLEIQRRQLALDELKLLTKPDLIKEEYTPHKLDEIGFNLSRALSAFEEAYSQTNSAFVIARIKSRIVSAIENSNELITFLIPYKAESADDINEINTLQNNLKILNVDMEGTLSDIQAGISPENLEDWIAGIYDRLSNINSQLKSMYRAHIIRRNAWISAEKEREFKEEQEALKLINSTDKKPLEPWKEDLNDENAKASSQTTDSESKKEAETKEKPHKSKGVQVKKIISIPTVEEENLLPQEKALEAKEQAEQEPQRITPDASYTEMLRRQIEEEARLKKEAEKNDN